MCDNIMSMMYIVTAINIYNSEERRWEYDNLVEANKKVRELKDQPSRYVIKFTTTSTVVV